MKTKNNKFSKTMQAIMIVAALSFSSNIHATSWGSWGSWTSWFGGGNNYGGGNNHRGGNNHGNRHYRGCGHTETPTKSVPLDGGLSILVLGAAAFGVRKLRGNKNDKA
ncbi:MAG: hypothetical protein ABJK28_13295 [Algibacter sp.]